MSDLFLLDTHVLLWAVAAPHRLASGVSSLIENHRYAISVASLWELINKKGKRDAPVKDPAGWWSDMWSDHRRQFSPSAPRMFCILIACLGTIGTRMTES